MTTDFAWAPTIQGPWTTIHKTTTGTRVRLRTGFVNFFSLVPALGYTVLSTGPPHVQVGAVVERLFRKSGTPQMSLWDFVLGGNYGGEAFGSKTGLGLFRARISIQRRASYGSFPRDGLVWSFDFLDQGLDSKLTNWPFFVDRGNNSAVITPCDNGYAATTACGYMNSGHGTSMNSYGIKQRHDSGYGGHFHTAPASTNLERFKTLRRDAG